MSHGDTFNSSNSSQDLLQQRLNETMTMTTSPLVGPPPRSARKILFGYPDPDLPCAVLASLTQRNWAGFCDKWNVDPVNGRPRKADSSAQAEVKPAYDWSLVATNDPEIIAAESESSGCSEEKQSMITSVTVQMDIAMAAVTAGSSSSQSLMKSADANQVKSSLAIAGPSGSTERIRNKSPISPPSAGAKRFCSGISSPGGRQRAITDYLKEKKALPTPICKPAEDKTAPASAVPGSLTAEEPGKCNE